MACVLGQALHPISVVQSVIWLQRKWLTERATVAYELRRVAWQIEAPWPRSSWRNVWYDIGTLSD